LYRLGLFILVTCLLGCSSTKGPEPEPEPTGFIKGRVVDITLDGITVEVRGGVRTVTVDTDGRFLAAGVLCILPYITVMPSDHYFWESRRATYLGEGDTADVGDIPMRDLYVDSVVAFEGAEFTSRLVGHDNLDDAAVITGYVTLDMGEGEEILNLGPVPFNPPSGKEDFLIRGSGEAIVEVSNDGSSWALFPTDSSATTGSTYLGQSLLDLETVGLLGARFVRLTAVPGDTLLVYYVKAKRPYEN